MDDETRLNQLEEIVVELLRKQDRTLEEIARLRQAQSEMNVLLVRIQNDVTRIDGESVTTRRVTNETVRVVHVLSESFAKAEARNEVFRQETQAGISQIIALTGKL